MTDTPSPFCTGSSTCTALLHVHGCYADYGRCDHPSEHPTTIVVQNPGGPDAITVTVLGPDDRLIVAMPLGDLETVDQVRGALQHVVPDRSLLVDSASQVWTLAQLVAHTKAMVAPLPPGVTHAEVTAIVATVVRALSAGPHPSVALPDDSPPPARRRRLGRMHL